MLEKGTYLFQVPGDTYQSFASLLNSLVSLVFQMARDACVEAKKSYTIFLSKIREVVFVHNWVQVFVSLCEELLSCLGG